MDCTPDPHLLRALKQQNLSWSSVLGELIDNSFDAAATRVVIETKQRNITIIDDGRGVRDMSSIPKLGGHAAGANTALGMYGIGLKDAWLFCGGEMVVETVHQGRWSKLRVDARHLMENNWQCPDPEVKEMADANSGTIVSFPLRKGRNRPSDSCFDNLSWMFTPALRDGRQIVWSRGAKSRKPLGALTLPQLIDSVRDEFDVDGKRVRIEIGIVSDGQSMPHGPFWVSYRHRNINRSSIGCGEFSDERMGGTIELLDGWSLSKNKDDLTDHKNDLSDAIHERILHLLRKSEQLSRDVEASELQNELEGMLNDALRQAKRERRTATREQPGTVEPKGSGRERKRASKASDEEGKILSGLRTKRGFRINFYHDDETDRIGEYDSLASRVRLNRSHSFIEAAYREKNIAAMYAVAVAILGDYCVSHRESSKLLFAVHDFSGAFGRILSSVKEFANVKSA